MYSFTNFELKVIRTFFYFSLCIYGLCGCMLILTGGWHYLSEELHNHVITYSGLIAIISGCLQLLWTVLGCCTVCRSSYELDVICVICCCTMLLIQLALTIIISAAYNDGSWILVTVFVASVMASALHTIMFIFKCRTSFSKKEKLLVEMSKSSVFRSSKLSSSFSFVPYVNKNILPF